MEFQSSSNPVSNLGETPSPEQLDSIKAQLDLVLLALESLTGVGSEAMLEVAKQTGVEALMSDRVTLWRLRQASPLRKGQGRKKLDVDEARGLVLVSAYLAQQHQQKIRQAVTLLEEATARKKPPHRVALLGDYLDAFSNFYEDRMISDNAPIPESLRDLALKLLIDLLFYSQSGGERRLWLALLERSR
ncbi:DUF3038 domain-containing protein [Oscillatoria sp. CS-180]|uniref:DUF3038 domain-containing protein n=1 Tax=Oscillatoria sp. CS-180 TaxID=3021720 RepID=UPI00232ED1AD|nr:DUF3038 domain-containing protein [Oscillatoria sp. CS-180]MDB9528139.1 DUF3038 domain-containing protein [Oscillatoria sp. CS-180]